MVERLHSLETYNKQELYFHHVYGGYAAHLAMAESVSSGMPLFTLLGRGALSRGEALFANSLVYFVPLEITDEVVEPLYPTPFECDDHSTCPTFYTYVQPCPAEWVSTAESWMAKYMGHPLRPEFLTATLADVRILSAQYFLGML